MSETTWVLIADASRARLLEHDRPRRSLEFVFERLRLGANEQRYGQLLLVAPPASSLRQPCSARYVGTMSSHELAQHLSEWLVVTEPPRLRTQTD
jgi:hypothetical protein